MPKVFEFLWQSNTIEAARIIPMFFLRCAFWLSLVYSSMTWSNASFATRDLGTQALEAGRAVATTVVNRTVAGVGEHCTLHPDACLTDAARLTSLFAASDGSDGRAPAAAKSVELETVPLPVPAPRHHGRAAKLARAP